MKKYKEFNERFDKKLIDELIDKGLESLTKKERDYLNDPHNVDLDVKQKIEKSDEEDKEITVKDEKTKSFIDSWKQQGKDYKKEWNKNTNKNLIKTIDLTERGPTVCISWIQLYYFIEENYPDFNKFQIYDIIKNILDAKIVHHSSDDDTDFIFIDKEYTREEMVWFNVSHDTRIKTVCVNFNEYEKFWIPRLLNAHNFYSIRIEDYKNRQ